MLSRRLRGDHGSTMILMPAGVLIVLLLAAVAFDLSWVYEAQHEAIDAAASAANDAVTFGVVPTSVQSGHGVRFDTDRIARAVDRSLTVHHLHGYRPDRTTITLDPATGTVTVGVTCHVDYVFARAIPRARDGRDVTGTGSATVVQR